MDRRERLSRARLYLCCQARPLPWLRAVLVGGVDVIQLRDKTLDDGGLVDAARAFREAADAAGALFVLNDRPELVRSCRADGVHLGQDDGTTATARAYVGSERIVGRSTHTPAQLAAAADDPDVDYVAVGPVHPTPTKPDRPPTGPGYVAYAAANDPGKPWFAIGGIDADTLPPLRAVGATRVVVVRALTEAADPFAAARALRAALAEVPCGGA